MPQFDHERLDVYQLWRELSREVAGILTELPRGCAESADNVRRATKSIGRNIAEGAGKWLLADKINFNQIARGSTTECAASLDEMVDFGCVSAERVERAKTLAWRITAMLIGMIRALEEKPERANGPQPIAPSRQVESPPPARPRPRPPGSSST